MVTPESSVDRRIVRADEWLALIEKEYLQDYVKAGGSAVKVISGSEECLSYTSSQLKKIAANNAYFVAYVDPAETYADGKKKDVHHIHKFFFEVTRTVDWKGWAEDQARRYLEKIGVYVAEGRQLSDLENIAADNGRDPQDLVNQYQREFATPLITDHGMAIEFRSAVTALGRAQLIPDTITPSTEEVLLAWFAGRASSQKMPGAPAVLKKIQIFEQINSANARYMLASFCRWLPMTGHSGLVVILDFRPYQHKRIPKTQRQSELLQKLQAAIDRVAPYEELHKLRNEMEDEPTISYSEQAYMQMLSMIRRFIDEIDWFERFLLVVLTSPSFYDKAARRNYWNYDALQTRIGLEVHDTYRANPMATLVHLGGSS